ncbi:MAG: hypothetical protein ABII79_08815 [bacterium]
MNTEKAVSTGVSLYTLAGWLSILQAVIILPRVGFDFFVESLSLSGSGMMQLITGFHAVGGLLGIYVLFMFRRLLNERHNFHNADSMIKSLIIIYAASAIVGAAGLFLIPLLDIMIVHVVLYFLSSLVSIVYAIKLLKLECNLSGLLKPYVYSTIAGGVCGVTLVLGEYGRPIFMVSLILLGIILIRAESEPEYL